MYIIFFSFKSEILNLFSQHVSNNYSVVNEI